jgi:hypothetical protein
VSGEWKHNNKCYQLPGQCYCDELRRSRRNRPLVFNPEFDPASIFLPECTIFTRDFGSNKYDILGEVCWLNGGVQLPPDSVVESFIYTRKDRNVQHQRNLKRLGSAIRAAKYQDTLSDTCFEQSQAEFEYRNYKRPRNINFWEPEESWEPEVTILQQDRDIDASDWYSEW